MRTFIHASILAVAALAATATSIQAEAHPYGRGGGYSHGGYGGWHGRGWGGVGLGIGLGVGLGVGSYYGGYYGGPYGVYYAPAYPTYVVQPPVYAEGSVPLVAATKPPPVPIVYPRNGQSAAQTEADRQACERWATTQPSAMADASVFQRATAACMDGRGYTVR